MDDNWRMSANISLLFCGVNCPSGIFSECSVKASLSILANSLISLLSRLGLDASSLLLDGASLDLLLVADEDSVEETAADKHE